MKICEGLPIQKYVLGFVFNLDKTQVALIRKNRPCLLYTSPSPRDVEESRMPSSA